MPPRPLFQPVTAVCKVVNVTEYTYDVLYLHAGLLLGTETYAHDGTLLSGPIQLIACSKPGDAAFHQHKAILY